MVIENIVSKIEALIENYDTLGSMYNSYSDPANLDYNRLYMTDEDKAEFIRSYLSVPLESQPGYIYDHSDHSTPPALIAGAGLAGGALLGAGLKKLYDKKKGNR